MAHAVVWHFLVWDKYMNKEITRIVLVVLVSWLSSTAMALEASKTKTNLELNEENPDSVSKAPDMVWRFVPSLGWRKFSPEGGQYYDWKDWERTTRPYWFRRW